jgi:hypothetical protein
MYTSAQSIDFIDFTENCTFLIRKFQIKKIGPENVVGPWFLRFMCDVD